MGTLKPAAKLTGNNKKRERDSDNVRSAEDGIVDPRFIAAETDPRFSRVPKRAKKAVVDGRFKRKLKENPAFRKSETPVDRFGRPRREQRLDEPLRNAFVEDENSDSDSDDDSQVEDPHPSVSYPDDDSDSDDSDIADFVDEGEPEPPEDIPRGKATRRLAVIGLDWSSTRAVDIFACLESFCPPGKSVQAVEVHPSKFGLERLAAEAKFGPQVMAKQDLKVVQDAVRQHRTSQASDGKVDANERDESDPEPESGESSSEEEDDNLEDKRWKEQVALRKYEEERLKYYYAVVEFEDVKAADAVYEQCDGVEYAQSGRAFDLRFIPGDMKIETIPRDRADKIPDGYVPPNVATSSLNTSTVKLSWDADDPDRVILKKKAVGKQQLDEENLKAYLASSSEDEGAQESTTELEKKRNLLLGPAEDELEDDADMGMEITFEPGMLEKAEEIIKRKKTKDEQQEETPWEARLRRLQERKLEKRKKRKEAVEALKAGGDVSRGNQGTSEDEKEGNEDTLGFEDPFFSEERTVADEVSRARKKKKARKKDSLRGEDSPTSSRDDEEEARKRAELELLVMDKAGKHGSQIGSMREKLAAADSDDDNDKRRSQRGRRGKRRVRRDKNEKNDEAEPSTMDMKDPRFQSLFDSHLFAIDPTHPKYRENNTTQKILKEKIRRTKKESQTDGHVDYKQNAPSEARHKKEENVEKKDTANSELRQLAARLKARAKVNSSKQKRRR